MYPLSRDDLASIQEHILKAVEGRVKPTSLPPVANPVLQKMLDQSITDDIIVLDEKDVFDESTGAQQVVLNGLEQDDFAAEESLFSAPPLPADLEGLEPPQQYLTFQETWYRNLWNARAEVEKGPEEVKAYNDRSQACQKCNEPVPVLNLGSMANRLQHIRHHAVAHSPINSQQCSLCNVFCGRVNEELLNHLTEGHGKNASKREQKQFFTQIVKSDHEAMAQEYIEMCFPGFIDRFEGEMEDELELDLSETRCTKCEGYVTNATTPAARRLHVEAHHAQADCIKCTASPTCEYSCNTVFDIRNHTKEMHDVRAKKDSSYTILRSDESHDLVVKTLAECFPEASEKRKYNRKSN